jgi:hypothetical protein
MACICCHCAQASAKSNVDGTDWCYNACCWHYVGTHVYIRRAYGLEGDLHPLRDACFASGCCGCFECCCYPCALRQLMFESRHQVGVLHRRLPPIVDPAAAAAMQSANSPAAPSGRSAAKRWGSPTTAVASSTTAATTEYLSPLCSACDCCALMQSTLAPCCVAHTIRQYVQPLDDEEQLVDYCCLVPCAMAGQVRQSFALRAYCERVEPATGRDVSLWGTYCCNDVCLPLWCYPCFLERALRECKARVRRPEYSLARGRLSFPVMK